MTSVDSNFNFLCGRPHGAGPPPPVHMRPSEPDPLPPPCGRHKWMVPYALYSLHMFLVHVENSKDVLTVLCSFLISYITYTLIYTIYNYTCIYRHTCMMMNRSLHVIN